MRPLDVSSVWTTRTGGMTCSDVSCCTSDIVAVTIAVRSLCELVWLGRVTGAERQTHPATR